MRVTIRKNFAHGNLEPSSALKPNDLAKQGDADVIVTDTQYKVRVNERMFTADKSKAEKLKNGVLMVNWESGASQSI